MGTYVLAYVGGEEPADEVEGKAVMDAWMAWFGGLGAAVQDGGNPFGPSGSVAPDGSTSIGAPSGLTGYSILTAGSLDEALDLAKGCPHLAAGGTVEVYETFDVMADGSA